MCGISGVFGRPDIETVKRMMGEIVHRGPDDGYSVAGLDFALGTRRLSIVGVVDGRQPLSNEDGTIWAAQNGELYNYPRVKEELLHRGHQLRTHTDTEILPHLYEDYGARLPEHIDGMFAIAIWDTVNRRGLLARDRMGKKPLYYYRDGDVLYFASEIKSLLRVPGFERRINLEALHHYLSFKHVPCPLSIFEGIRMLPPAHALDQARSRRSVATGTWTSRAKVKLRTGRRKSWSSNCSRYCDREFSGDLWPTSQ
jgi:asparagine synthase (glutamine-hydrolysing)